MWQAISIICMRWSLLASFTTPPSNIPTRVHTVIDLIIHPKNHSCYLGAFLVWLHFVPVFVTVRFCELCLECNCILPSQDHILFVWLLPFLCPRKQAIDVHACIVPNNKISSEGQLQFALMTATHFILFQHHHEKKHFFFSCLNLLIDSLEFSKSIDHDGVGDNECCDWRNGDVDWLSCEMKGCWKKEINQCRSEKCEKVRAARTRWWTLVETTTHKNEATRERGGN